MQRNSYNSRNRSGTNPWLFWSISTELRWYELIQIIVVNQLGTCFFQRLKMAVNDWLKNQVNLAVTVVMSSFLSFLSCNVKPAAIPDTAHGNYTHCRS